MSTATKHNWKLDPVHGLNCDSRYGRKCNCPTNAPTGAEGEWLVHEGEDYVVVLGGEYDTTENPIAQCFDVQIAAQIVADHKAAKSQALLVEALRECQTFLENNTHEQRGVYKSLLDTVDAALKQVPD
jgi:predicted metal-binding protein